MDLLKSVLQPTPTPVEEANNGTAAKEDEDGKMKTDTEEPKNETTDNQNGSGDTPSDPEKMDSEKKDDSPEDAKLAEEEKVSAEAEEEPAEKENDAEAKDEEDAESENEDDDNNEHPKRPGGFKGKKRMAAKSILTDPPPSKRAKKETVKKEKAKKEKAKKEKATKKTSPRKAKKPAAAKAEKGEKEEKGEEGRRSIANLMVYEGAPTKPMKDGSWPEGWIERQFKRASGGSKGHLDFYFYPPTDNGKEYKLRSMAEVQRYLETFKKTKNHEKAFAARKG